VRHVVLDTETTGLSPDAGHRIVEIGCVEIQDGVLTGRTFHRYINPERDVPDEAFRVHGLSQSFLATHPKFVDHHVDFLDFIRGATLVIHNASFDMKFLNAEMAWLKKPALSHTVIDTLSMARKQFPGSPANLDALCRRFQIDLSQRTHHGALLDAQLLAHVYQSMTAKTLLHFSKNTEKHMLKERPLRTPRSFSLSPKERADYRHLLDRLSKYQKK
jgi:DNA polymerase-3 subunit epsilon